MLYITIDATAILEINAKNSGFLLLFFRFGGALL